MSLSSSPSSSTPHPVADNPLLDFSGLPRFADFDPAQVGPALDALLAEGEAAVARAQADATPATWDAFVEPLEDATERLGRAWGIVSHLNSVADSPALRDAYTGNLPRITQFWTALGQNEALFAKYRALRDSAEFATLSPARQRIVENALRDFRLGGAELRSPKRERYAQIQERQAHLSQQFSEHVLDATNAYELAITDEQRLAGLPGDARQAAADLARTKGKQGWLFTLQFPSYFPVMQYADDRALRETLYRAYSTRASEQAAAPADPAARAALDNGGLIDEILALRHEEAQLLGYPSFADVSLVPKMADSPQQVATFLRDLARRARPFALRDLAELREFAADELGLRDLKSWDTAWASEKLKESRYAFSDQEVKQYFQLPRVLQGLFGVIERLFDVRIAPDDAQVWHPDVKFFRIERDGALIGQFYLDLFARESKRPGAWMDDARARRRKNGTTQTPVAYLTCNFQPPVGERPALLNHDDVITLFHEFGHGLHHLLTRVDELAVSGISGVEWDAVELPSQFMENYCWDQQVIASMSAHVDTGEPLPKVLFDRMVAARNFQAGLQTLRQIEFALFDMQIHSRAPADAADVQKTLDAVRAEVAVLVPPAFNRFQNSFSHIFAGGYAAGYYSYKWAE
ncbi:MAG: M3 family metallopeptidase, partial [Burkholderiaceae bacterium]